MSSVDVARAVLKQFPAGRVSADSADIVDLRSAGGFSGARFWKITTSSEVLCLRRWPRDHPSSERLREIHSVLQHVRNAGLTCVPAPRSADNGETMVMTSGHLWELSPWLPGTADYRTQPCAEKLVAALETLARFHIGAATTPHFSHPPACPRGLLDRLQMLEDLRCWGFHEIEAAINRAPRSEFSERGQRILPWAKRFASIGYSLLKDATATVPIQPCIRDIWHDHVLFSADVVSGIVDFGAMRSENVAGDVARLLGSLVGDSADDWTRGMEAYARIRPLSMAERKLVHAYDVSGVILAGIQWLRWIFVEDRQFENRHAIVERLDQIIGRLERFAERIQQ